MERGRLEEERKRKEKERREKEGKGKEKRTDNFRIRQTWVQIPTALFKTCVTMGNLLSVSRGYRLCYKKCLLELKEKTKYLKYSS